MGWLNRIFGGSIDRPPLPTDDRIALWIERDVRCGYGTEPEIVDRLRLYLRHHPRADDWVARLEAALAAQRVHEQGWLEPTANDRLDAAFAELDARGILAVQDASITLSDAWCVVGELAEERPDAWGATFFHRQDVEDAVDGGPLHLAFGAFDEGPEHEAKSLGLAREVCATLRRHDFEPNWNGSIDQRIALPAFPWRKRRSTRPPA